MENEEDKKQRESHVKSLRLLKLEKALQSIPYPGVERLMKELDVSRRTVLRDLEELKIYYNAPIEYDRLHKGYYYTDETFFVKNVLVSEGELVAMAGILPLLERYDNTPLQETIEKVYDTVCQILPNQVQVQTSLLNQVQFISDPLAPIEASVFTSLFQAIKNHKNISFGYRSLGKTEHSPHSLDPYKIYCQKGDWYLIGYSHEHQTYRTYHLSRMKDIQLLSEYEVDPDYEKKVHIDPNFGIWNNDQEFQKIELLFDKSINTYILERTWHKNQVCRQNEDGSVYLSFETNQIQEILYWVLHFGSSVQILNPPELKKKYQEEVKKMLKNVKKGLEK